MRRTRPARCSRRGCLRRGLEEPLKSRAKVGRAADVRLGARVGAIQRKDRRRLRQRRQRGFGIRWIEGKRLNFRRHGPGPPRGARHAFAFKVILRRMCGKRTSLSRREASPNLICRGDDNDKRLLAIEGELDRRGALGGLAGVEIALELAASCASD